MSSEDTVSSHFIYIIIYIRTHFKKQNYIKKHSIIALVPLLVRVVVYLTFLL